MNITVKRNYPFINCHYTITTTRLEMWTTFINFMEIEPTTSVKQVMTIAKLLTAPSLRLWDLDVIHDFNKLFEVSYMLIPEHELLEDLKSTDTFEIHVVEPNGMVIVVENEFITGL